MHCVSHRPYQLNKQEIITKKDYNPIPPSIFKNKPFYLCRVAERHTANIPDRLQLEKDVSFPVAGAARAPCVSWE